MENERISREKMYSVLLKMIAENLEDHDILSIGIDRGIGHGFMGGEWEEHSYNGRQTVTIEFGPRVKEDKKIKSVEELAKIASDAIVKEMGGEFLDEDEINTLCQEVGGKLDDKMEGY